MSSGAKAIETVSRFVAAASRCTIHGLTWTVLIGTLGSPQMAFAAFFGGAFGCLGGGWLGRWRLRTPAILVGGTVLVGLMVGARQLTVGSSIVAEALGPIAALRVADVAAALWVPMIVSAVLRACSVRRAVFSVFELILVAVAFAQLLMPHREGAINRPFRLADPIIAVGWDPTWLFVFVGGVAALMGVFLLLKEQRAGRAFFHIGVVCALLALIVALVPVIGFPSLEPRGGGLGMYDGKPSDADEGREQRRGARGPRPQGSQTQNELEFRDDYRPDGPNPPVAVVLFHDDYSPPTGNYYFRQGAFSQYNGRKMVVSGRGDVDQDLIPTFPARPAKIKGAPALNDHRSPLETTVALLADHTQPFALEAPVEVEPLNNPDPNRFQQVYGATSAVLAADYAAMLDYDLGADDWSEELWAHYTEAPDDARYEALAQEIVGELREEFRDNPMAQAFAVTEWLSRKGVYSMTNTHSDADDPAASFLFGDLTGYCVHFAHAAAYLMRTLGVPTRVATGYAIEESARQGGSALLLAGSFSHAWPEVYVDDFGWVVLDVYPNQALDQPPQPLDADLQRLLGELARGASPIPFSATELPKLKELARRVGVATTTWLLILLASVLTVFFAIKVWRRTAPLWAPAGALPRVMYRAELDRLADVSVARRRGESRESFATRIEQELPSFGRLTRVHIAAVFGDRRQDPKLLKSEAVAARRDFEARFPRWKRFLGLLTPWSWLRSK